MSLQKHPRDCSCFRIRALKRLPDGPDPGKKKARARPLPWRARTNGTSGWSHFYLVSVALALSTRILYIGPSCQPTSMSLKFVSADEI